MFTSFFGTTMIFLMVLPAMNGCTFSDALAAASSAALSALAGNLDDVAQLAVHLHRNFHLAFDEQRRIELRPGRVSQVSESRS